MKANAPEKIYIFDNPILDFTKLVVERENLEWDKEQKEQKEKGEELAKKARRKQYELLKKEFEK